MYNGIHNLTELIEYLAEEAICEVGWKHCGQFHFMAEDLGITVNELVLAMLKLLDELYKKRRFSKD